MGGFCVFGVTMEDCVARATKKIRVYDKELKRNLTPLEHKEKVDALAKEMFVACHRAKQISPAFDAPQFAKDWIEVAKRTINAHSIKIMARDEKIDEKGNPVLRKGKPVIGWTPYSA